MKKSTLTVVLVLIICTVTLADSMWGVPLMPLEEVKPGMTGIGKTVFYGSKIEEFGFEVLEIIENHYPKIDVILVRLSGEQAVKNGVVSGMSGSPVYIDGKLVGALALRFGSFMKEPIGGVMPIEAMNKVAEQEAVRNKESSSRAVLFPRYMDTMLCGNTENLWQTIAGGIQNRPISKNTSLSQIQSPLLFSGFDTRLVAQHAPLFESMGFMVTTGGSGSSQAFDENAPIEPGSAVSQVFITGDMSIESTGTVTAVQDQSLIAFGHYIFNLGPINLPLARANILATLPSMMGSSKMASSTDIVGVFRQDRISGVYGDLSIKPQTIPIDLNMTTVAGQSEHYHFEMAYDEAVNNITPLFLRTVMIQALTTGRLAGNQNSMQMNCTISFEDGRSVKLDDFFSSDQRFGFLVAGEDINRASDLLASALGVLLVNDFKSPAISSIQIESHEIKGENIAQIKNIWQNKKTVTREDTLNFSIELESTQNEKFKIHRSFPVPPNLDASRLTIFISSADPLTQYEVQTNRSKYVPVDFDHLLSILGERRKNNYLYIQILVRDRGLMLEGKEMSALPPSVMNVMSTIKTNGSSQNIQSRVLYEEAIPTDYVITGAKRLSVRVSPPPKASTPDEDGEQPAQPIYW